MSADVYPRPRTITREEFVKKVGREPIGDDLARCNCPRQGQLMHMSCGWDEEAQLPRFETGPVGHIIYVLCPSTDKSSSDNQQHYLKAKELANLYNVDFEDCLILNKHTHAFFRMRRFHTLLLPRQDGKYLTTMEKYREEYPEE